MPDSNNQHAPLKWGDSLDLLSDKRKSELRDRIELWTFEQATVEHPGPFAGERLNGLETLWLAACALAGPDGDPISAATTLSDPFLPSPTRLSTLNLRGADLRGASLSKSHLYEANMRGVQLKGANLSEADLRKADLREADIRWANFSQADLRWINLSDANLHLANMHKANLSGAILQRAYLSQAHMYKVQLHESDLREADLTRAHLYMANLAKAQLHESDLREANLSGANLGGANLRLAKLQSAILHLADLYETDLHEANLSGADLGRAQLVRTSFKGAILSGCQVYGAAVWSVTLDGATQLNLRITPPTEPEITVDNLDVAQLLYLMPHNDKISHVLDTIAKKLVLILGCFSPERKAILDALRTELRHRNYVPVVFDFEKPSSRDLTETVSALAHLARFVIADLTDARSVAQELTVIIPNLPSVAILPLVHVDDTEYAMFEHWHRYRWVLETYRYATLDALLATLKDRVIDPAEHRANEIAPLQF